MRCSGGQATVDYVALIAALAVLLTIALVLAPAGAPGVVNAVAGQLRHALCVVGGGACRELSRQPCTVASRRDARHVAVSLVVVRVDHDRYVLREVMSDKTIRLTLARSGAAGLEAASGARAKVNTDGREVGMTDEVRLGAQAVLGSGRVFVARDGREAAALMRAIRDGDDPAASAREVFYHGGVRGLATIGIGNSVATTSLRALAAGTIGARRDRRTGDVTLAVNAGGSGWGAVTIALGRAFASEERLVTLGLMLDRGRRPKELSLSTSGTVLADAALPPALARALGGRRSPTSVERGGRRWELTARLDLRDPLVAAAWNRFRDDPAGAHAIRGLGEAIRDRARLDMRTYRTNSASNGVAAGIGRIVQVAGELDHTIEDSRLLSASSRPPGGLWEQRLDCVAR